MAAVELLSEAEHLAMNMIADLVNLVVREVIGTGASRDCDINEFCAAVHVVQNFILSQAAARAYPTRYRLSGRRVASG